MDEADGMAARLHADSNNPKRLQTARTAPRRLRASPNPAKRRIENPAYSPGSSTYTHQHFDPELQTAEFQ